MTNNTSQVTGNIDSAPTASGPNIGGWACSTGLNPSINVELYVGGPAGGGGTRIGSYAADLASEPAVASACQASGTNYRFVIPLGTATRSQYAGQKIYLYGDSPVGNNNNELTNSGIYTVPANPQPPAPPASVTVPSSSSTGSATVSWSASANVTSYVLQQSFNGGGWTQVYSGTSTSYALSGLGNGNDQYRVDACNANGCSAFTNSNTLNVAILPAAPASITAPATSYSASFTVSWSASSNASSYVLQQSANGGAWGQVYAGGATGTSVTVLASGNDQYRVSACGAGGCSGYTASDNVAVTLPPASAASLSGPSSSSSGTYTLSWTQVSGATRYQLNQSANGGSWSAVYNAGGQSWTSTGVGSGSYVYGVYACNAGGCSAASNQVTLTVKLIPAAPASVTAPSVATVNKAFSVSWSASSEATFYNLRQTLVQKNTTSTVYSGPSTGKSITLSGPAGDDFQYAAQACNANGCSGWTHASHSTYLQNQGRPNAMPASGTSL